MRFRLLILLCGIGSMSAWAIGPLRGVISIPASTTVELGQSAPLFPITLSSPAPANGLEVTLSSSDGSIVTVTSSVFFAAGTTTLPASQAPLVTGAGYGSAVVVAAATGYQSGSGTVTVPNPLTFTGSPLVVLEGGTAYLTLHLTTGQLPPNGLTVTLNSSNPSSASVPDSVSFVPGTNSVAVPVTGGLPGSAIITAVVGDLGSATASVAVIGRLRITAGCPVSGTVGTPFSFVVSATGGVLPYSYSLVQGSLPSGLTLHANGLTDGTPLAAGAYPVVIQVTDSGAQALRQTAIFACSISISPPPPVQTFACPASPAPVGSPYQYTLTATGNGPFSWSIPAGSLPPGLVLNGSTIAGTPASQGTYNFTVQLSQGNQATTQACSLTVISSKLQITSGCPVNGTVDTPFAFAVSATGGVAPYSYTLVSGSLPSGLNLNLVTGLIDGKPLASGASVFSIQVTDSAPPALRQTAALTCSVAINPPTPGQLQTFSCPASPAPEGSPYQYALTAPGNGPFRWSIVQGSLPAGLVLTGSTISGIPTTPGTSNFTIQLSTDLQTTAQDCSLTVTSSKLQITSSCPADGTQGVAYPPLPLQASGGNGVYVFSIANGSLPEGLTLNGNTISGTPAGPPGRASFTFQVTSAGATATGPLCVMNVLPAPLTIAGTCPASAQVGTLSSTPVQVSGGTPPYTFSFSGSSWLSFTNGVVSGTPPAVGSGSFTVTVSDSAKVPPKTFACNFPVTSPLAIDASCPARPLAVNAPFTLPLGASGGGGTYRWSVEGPSWLSLSSASGATTSLTGTPPTEEPVQFAVTLSDSSGTPPVSFSCTLTANHPLGISASGTCPASPVAFYTPISVSAAAVGGTPPYKWSLTGPSWLSITGPAGPTVGLSGSAATEGANSFTLTLTDSANTQPATFGCSLTVNALPNVSITGPTASGSGQDQTITVTPPPGFPGGLDGKLTLTFTPNGSLPDDPAIQFQNGSRTVDFPSGQPPQILVKTGTVAGVITITPSFSIGGRDVTPPNTSPLKIQIAPEPPVQTSVDCVRTSSTAFNVIVDGYTNTREATQANFTFQAASGANLGTAQLQLNAAPLFSTWFSSAGSAASGGTFRYTQTFNVQGNAADIAAVSVRLANSVGSAVTQGAATCRAQ